MRQPIEQCIVYCGEAKRLLNIFLIYEKNVPALECHGDNGCINNSASYAQYLENDGRIRSPQLRFCGVCDDNAEDMCVKVTENKYGSEIKKQRCH